MSQTASTGQFVQSLMHFLKQKKVDLDPEGVADMLWLATRITPTQLGEVPVSKQPSKPPETKTRPTQREQQPEEEPTYPLTVPPSQQPEPETKSVPTSKSPGLTVETPAAPALRQPLDLGRALRPLMCRVPSRTDYILDEEATAIRMAERKWWTPVMVPAPERWLSVALVVEQSDTTAIWQDMIHAFQALLERQGAFRDVRRWRLDVENGVVQLFSKAYLPLDQQQPRPVQELANPGGRCLILVISDGMSSAWQAPQLYDCLARWSQSCPVAMLQLLPERLWSRSALGTGVLAQLSSLLPGVVNAQLAVDAIPLLEDINVAAALKIPVVTLLPDPLLRWAKVVAGCGNARTAGVLFEPWLAAAEEQLAATLRRAELTPEVRVQRFRATASPIARRLAVLMSLVPVSLPVIYLIQQTSLPEAKQVHIAEVLMGGLLERRPSGNKADPPHYEFSAGVREFLNQGIPRSKVDEILDAVSAYISQKAGLTIKSFTALLAWQAQSGEGSDHAQVQEFAHITKAVLRRMGGSHRAWVESLGGVRSTVEPQAGEQETNFPELQTLEFELALYSDGTPVLQTQAFEVATVTVEAPPKDKLQRFNFETATLAAERTKISVNWVIHRQQLQAWQYIEVLGEGIELEMVSIPAGTFMMGSPQDKLEWHDDEGPQHEVTVPTFFMAKYPVTQAQWKAVAALPQVKRKLDPDPANFKGKRRPVERVSWWEAIEFCDRLSQATGRRYRLPSEAEWEYACRAGITTSFSCGETLSSELANYIGTVTYAEGPKGIYRKETTEVGSFPANAYGLYDLHGNVREWCADHWHEDYEGAPKEGRAWLDENDNDSRINRGGSWGLNPRLCRSAYRGRGSPDAQNYYLGFRVACTALRGLR